MNEFVRWTIHCIVFHLLFGVVMVVGGLIFRAVVKRRGIKVHLNLNKNEGGGYCV